LPPDTLRQVGISSAALPVIRVIEGHCEECPASATSQATAGHEIAALRSVKFHSLVGIYGAENAATACKKK